MPGAPDHAEELIGSLVDERYSILEAMASGSMGAVYKAERVPVGKLVAIKFLHAAFANDAEFLSRFERETRVMSKLAHPNCVSVLDFGVYEGSPYIVMDFVAGRTLRSILDEGPLSPPRALSIARQIAAGLAHAHAQGVVHRDVKPANIMISEEIATGEHARILDFGLARLRGAVGRDATQSNVVVGTPNYMAPEQTIGGGTIDARTDVYAVGVVLFEMLAGERPFQAEDTLALLGMHRAAPIPKLADRIPAGVELPDGIQQVIDRAMAKSPADRFQSAIELAEAIDLVATGRAATTRDMDTVATPQPRVLGRKKANTAAVAPTQIDISIHSGPRPRRSSSSTMLGALVAIVLLGGGAYAAWYWKGRTASEAVTSSSPRVADGVQADASPNVARGLADAAEASGASGLADASVAPTADADLLPEPSALDAGAEPAEDEDDAPESDTEIDMAPDPTIAENLGPVAPEADDEAADAPTDEKDAEKRAPPPPPKRATTIHDAVVLIKAGKSELALSSLHVLKKKHPKSAYIPFLLGSLYFDKQWWSVALSHYGTAIKINADYKKNPTLIRNVIRMLGSKKTSGTASHFLRFRIGKPAIPYLKLAAQNSPNGHVKWNAQRLLQLGLR
jgi:eukaryotic-like serine/threonine-protein kinase